MKILPYISIFLIICCIVYYFTIIIIFKIKSKFWYIQPCYHYYDFHYIFYKNQVIQTDLPKLNQFVSFDKVITYNPEDIHKNTFNYIIQLLKNEYYHTTNAIYEPSIDSVLPYLLKNYYTSYVSLYVSPTYLQENDSLIKYNDILGCIMSKPIHIRLTKSDEIFYSYYVDFFCIKREYRKMGYSEMMIQTHEYFNRTHTKNIQVHLFKREGELTGIVPLVKYNTYLYEIPVYKSDDKIVKNIINSIYPSLIQIDKTNIILLYDYLKLLDNFTFIAQVNILNLLELITTKNVFCFVVYKNNTIISCYFFRNTYMKIKNMSIDENYALSCFSSINNNFEEFYTFFEQSISIIQRENKNIFKFLFIENLSHNYLLIKDNKNKIVSTSKTAYFLYNYIHQPIEPKNVLLII
jgi:hypothetical protein